MKLLDRLHIIYTLEFQVMYGHDGLNSPEELILLEAVVQINRNKTCLPVMAVNNVRAEIQLPEVRKALPWRRMQISPDPREHCHMVSVH